MTTTNPRKRKWKPVPGENDKWEYSDFSGEIGRLYKLERIEGVPLRTFLSMKEANRWLNEKPL